MSLYVIRSRIKGNIGISIDERASVSIVKPETSHFPLYPSRATRNKCTKMYIYRKRLAKRGRDGEEWTYTERRGGEGMVGQGYNVEGGCHATREWRDGDRGGRYQMRKDTSRVETVREHVV